ncbi:stage III sporulation protein AE [Irregularibacter muris]|uniref:Stage III sporulation protein AE n=1 Tax=Irregularibacter muris TaxID=1796619 RepID=A0AAE3KZ22_9FIRM|nr:stage III sporulation protein AE [Irregularibacter muris]MCR1897991.1 stage III sporulation protein AE [Irregularibacter muris]
MKKIILIMLIILLVPSVVMAQEDGHDENLDNEQLVDEILNKMDTSDLEEIIGQTNMEMNEYLPQLNLRDLLSSIAKGKFSFDIKSIFTGMAKYLFNEVINNSGLLSRLVLLSIVCAILQNLQNSFESNAVGQIAFNVVYLVILAIAIQSFATAIEIGKETIDSMVVFMQALLPTLIILLTSMGAFASAALFQPLITITITMLSTFVQNVILPMIFFASILTIINYISERVQISKLAGLIKQVSIVLLGFALTIFLGVMTIQGVSSASFDGVTARTAKYAVDNLLPIIGGFLSDALDTIIGCSLLVKNAIGVIGLIFLFLTMAFPIVKILALIFIYKVSSAIIQPIADGRIVNCLNDMAKSLTLIFVSVVAVAMMFFIVITIIVGAGNATVMMR